MYVTLNEGKSLHLLNVRDSSSLLAPQNDGLGDFFNSLLKHGKNECFVFRQKTLARIFQELLAATTDFEIHTSEA